MTRNSSEWVSASWLNKKAILWIIGITVLTVITIYSGLDEIIDLVVKINPLYLIGLFSLQVFTLLLVAFQWYSLIKKIESSVTLREVFFVHMAGKFVESVTPSSKFGGESAKLFLLKNKIGIAYKEVLASLLAHKYISMLPFVVICILFLSLAPFTFTLPTIVYISFGGLIIGFLFLSILIFFVGVKRDKKVKRQKSKTKGFLQKIKNKISKAISYLRESSERARDLLSKRRRNELLLISVIIWCVYPLKTYLVGTAVGLEISLFVSVIATYSAYLISMLPVSPGGLGTFEGTMALIFSLNGLTFTDGMAIALLTRSVTFWFPFFLSAFFTAYLARMNDIPILSRNESAKA